MAMTLDELQNVVLLFSNPVWAGQNTIPSTIIRNLTALSGQLAYSADYNENMTVLVSGYAETDNGLIQGLLYVPDLSGDDPCRTLEREYVPASAVRQVNLPPTNYNLIALAPWFNINCSKAYLLSARLDPLRAFLFYHPSDSRTKPPDESSPAWDLNDGGQWKSQNHYPVFAVSGYVGSEMMAQLSLYSGNLTEVPYGDNISSLYNPDPADYVRIWTVLTVSSASGLPNMWVFILAVVGVLLLVIATTCCLMHLTWRQRRKSLRRRVLQGQVNLEGSGIKRLTVPMSHVDTFPLFTYNYEAESASVPTSPTSPKPPRRPRGRRRSSRGQAEGILEKSVAVPKQSTTEDGPRSPGVMSVGTDLDYQPSCPICLENYQHRSTIIRELPCGHIYHPDCIGEFLSQISSLCPMCKASMLPKGYCPPITNSMVRRELATRRLRDRVVVEESDTESGHGRIHSWGNSVKKRLFSVSSATAPVPFNATVTPPPARRNSSHPQEIELRSQSQPHDGQTQQEDDPEKVRKRRMRELAGPDIESDDGNTPTWKKVGRNIFPGFQ